MKIICRPLLTWPSALRTNRKRSRFDSPWTATRELLEREARMLGAREIVIQLALDESQIRLDGWPYAAAKTSHPGVTVVLPETHNGRLSWTTDIYTTWQDNVRAIAVSMEALRAADRHGIMQGRQYAGFRELGSGPGSGPMTVEGAANLLADHGGGLALDALDDPHERVAMYRRAVKRLHPDLGGDPDVFRRIEDAKRLLDEHGGAS